ncbi:uncharacterized protein CXorf65-like [Corticium candelabrum]|uniref:uncharacterized protein CXorf65-like n=1 Tax=Corticium candelabrum TaxID=121492 RepID=UPI002E2595C2|nr:uncharacterized protein CXorf65-like [Corticium candelabrum]XP_062508923.1 uncharacterized protein CXorf65-like [Corticium candelabrum]
MFIQIYHGDGKTCLVNSFCRTIVLLEHIKKCCGYDSEVAIDLADETGQAKNLPSHLYSYASELLVPNGIFVPLRIDKDCDGQITYTRMATSYPTSRSQGQASSRLDSGHGHHQGKRGHSAKSHDKSATLSERQDSRQSNASTAAHSYSTANYSQHSAVSGRHRVVKKSGADY